VPLAYYHCRRCGKGQKPGERLWGLVGRQLSLGAEQIVSLAGALASFQEASRRVLQTMAGLKLSESTVHRGVDRSAGSGSATPRGGGVPM